MVLEGDGLSSPKRRNKVEDETNDDRKTREEEIGKRPNETVDEKNTFDGEFTMHSTCSSPSTSCRGIRTNRRKKQSRGMGSGEEFGDAWLYGRPLSAKRTKNKKQEDEKQDSKKKKRRRRGKEEMTAEEQEAMDKEDRETRERIRKSVVSGGIERTIRRSFEALVQRNERDEMEAKKKVPTPKKTKPVKKEAPTAEELVKK